MLGLTAFAIQIRLTFVNVYLDGKVDLIIEEVIAENGVIEASSNMVEELLSLKDALGILWFNLSMTNSHLLGLEKEQTKN